MSSPPGISHRCGQLERIIGGILALTAVIAFLGLGEICAQARTSPDLGPAPPRQALAKPLPEAKRGVQALAAPSSDLPVNRPPQQAEVRWDSRGLEIEALNSSLDQILRQVAAVTGARLEGLRQDQRVFGSYGPGPACDVVAKLLEGSGYNVLMIGSRDTDAPRAIILSARLALSPQTAKPHSRKPSEHAEAGESSEPELQAGQSLGSPKSQAGQNPFSNGGPPRDPLDLMNEILHRQEQIDQQQQNEQKK